MACSGTYCLCTLPGELTSHGLHRDPTGFGKTNFPPKPTLPPAGPPVNLLRSPELLLLDLGRSFLLCATAAGELSAEFPVCIPGSASRWGAALVVPRSRLYRHFNEVTNDSPSLPRVFSTSASPSSMIGSLKKRRTMTLSDFHRPSHRCSVRWVFSPPLPVVLL